MAITVSDISNLAKEFTVVLQHWLTVEELAAVNAENLIDLECCASHKYCDADEAMITAQIICGFTYSDDGEHKAIAAAAWALAKAGRFTL